MTRQKNLKRRVRSRMEKTGERYAAARRQLIDAAERREQSQESAEQAPQQPTQQSTQQPAQQPAGPVQGMRFSDESLRERTGRGWDEWFALLDAWDATTHTHTLFARWLV
jgi:hypothetical protein